MSEPSARPTKGVNPVLRYLPLLAILILVWPLSGQSLEVFGLELSAPLVGGVLAVLGAVSGVLAARSR